MSLSDKVEVLKLARNIFYQKQHKKQSRKRSRAAAETIKAARY
jgi:hypothetical protein